MAMSSLPPGHSDAELLMAKAHVLLDASRQRIAASGLLVARGTTARGPGHPIVRGLRARRDSTRRAQLRGGLTPTARVVLAEADRLLEACRAWHRIARGPLGVPRSLSGRPEGAAPQNRGWSRRPGWSSPG
jgi:hypothetical protein